MCDGYADRPSFIVNETRKTKRLRKCDACGEGIQPGHRYDRIRGVWDGQPSVVVRCLRCVAIYDAIVRHGNMEQEDIALTLDCGEIWQDTIGHLPDEVASLAFALPGDVFG